MGATTYYPSLAWQAPARELLAAHRRDRRRWCV